MSKQYLSVAGASFIRLHEGFVPRWYLDPVKVPTIGIGFTWRSTAFREWWGRYRPGVKFAEGATMTAAEAEMALRYLSDREYGEYVVRFLGRKVPQHVFDAMVSVVYNLGPRALEWKWAAAAGRGDYTEAARLLRATGTTAGGKVLPGLVKRRQDEAALLERGVYNLSPIAVKPSADPMADGVLVRGERGAAVARLIRDLAALGYYSGKLDDIFGRATEAAVLEFQRRNGLTVDGKAGPKTLAVIASHRPPVDAASEPSDNTSPQTSWLYRLLAWLFS